MFNSCSHIIFISFYTFTFHTKKMLNKPHNRKHRLLHCVIRSLRVFVSTYLLLNKDKNNANRTTQHGIIMILCPKFTRTSCAFLRKTSPKRVYNDSVLGRVFDSCPASYTPRLPQPYREDRWL